MKTKSYQASEERLVLTALITNSEVLAAASNWRQKGRDLFPSRWSNKIARWCFDYFDRYQKAPGKHIKTLYLKHAQTDKDADSVALIETYLQNLSKEHESSSQQNEKFLIDLASAFFEKGRLQSLAERLEAAVTAGDLEEARTLQAQYEPLRAVSSDWVNPFSEAAVQTVFRRSDEDQIVVDFPGALGEFLSPYFTRGGFISFCGPDKRGKSFWLQEVVFQALRQHRRVVYYVLGDMSAEDVQRRLYQRLLRRPWRTKQVRMPVNFEIRKRQPYLEYREEQRGGISPKRVLEGIAEFNLLTSAKEPKLRLRCDGGLVVSAGDIERDVHRFAEKEGWVADLVVIDYADLLAPEAHTRTQDVRHQMNASWMVMRRIALQTNSLVVTATQTASTAYESFLIRKRDFSEDKRKNAHVTGMIGINQTETRGKDIGEKERGIYRLNWVVLRGGPWSESQVVWTAGNLDIANPCIKSAM